MDIGLAGKSAKIPRSGLHAVGQVAEIMHPAGDQVIYVTFGFQHAVHGLSLIAFPVFGKSLWRRDEID